MRVFSLVCCWLVFVQFCWCASYQRPLALPTSEEVRDFLEGTSRSRFTVVHVLSPFKSANEAIEREHELLRYALLNASHTTARHVDVRFVAAVLPSDRAGVGDYPLGLALAGRTTLCALNRSFDQMLNVSRPGTTLPFFSDVLDCAAHMHYDALVYTNFDIVPMPYFYGLVAKLRADPKKGPTAVYTITRKVLRPSSHPHEDLPAAYARYTQADGKKHPGHDCYIFPNSKVDFQRGRPLGITVGGAYGATLMNMMWDRSLGLIKMNSLGSSGTFHVDDDRGGRDLWLASEWNVAMRFACTDIPDEAFAIRHFLNPTGHATLTAERRRADCKPDDALPYHQLGVYSLKMFKQEFWLEASHNATLAVIRQRITDIVAQSDKTAKQGGRH